MARIVRVDAPGRRRSSQRRFWATAPVSPGSPVPTPLYGVRLDEVGAPLRRPFPRPGQH
ncbi:hypothetical protein ACFY19_09570 [Streptosporangium saharense]|uniref:hypothetical protein n=1 Tax=Streptosporangium saharense TaxID=1706840 RepID=UPI003690CA4E